MNKPGSRVENSLFTAIRKKTDVIPWILVSIAATGMIAAGETMPDRPLSQSIKKAIDDNIIRMNHGRLPLHDEAFVDMPEPDIAKVSTAIVKRPPTP